MSGIWKTNQFLPLRVALATHIRVFTQTLEIWGTGTPRREFLHVDDCAEACVFLMEKYDEPDIVNIGYGQDVSIRELAELVKKAVGYEGALKFNTSKPDGMFQKLLDVSKINRLGWKAKIRLEEGLRTTVEWFMKNRDTMRK
jgi:GDP-L-fucose synthase